MCLSCCAGPQLTVFVDVRLRLDFSLRCTFVALLIEARNFRNIIFEVLMQFVAARHFRVDLVEALNVRVDRLKDLREQRTRRGVGMRSSGR